MIPILYENGETAFTSNGLGRLADCISCTVTEERNGIYECQFTYPVTGEMYSEIQIGRILGVIHDDAKDVQPFDIYSKSAPLNGVVTFYAHHISYRLGGIILRPMTATSCAAALAAIPQNTYNRCPFTFWTDKSVIANWKVEVPSAVKAVLGGQQGSILDVYGKGEYQWDKWEIKLYTNRGNDNGVAIRYGVNLANLTHEYDDSESYNAVAPYWRSTTDGTVVTLSNGYVSVSTGTKLVPWTTASGDFITTASGEQIYFKVAEKMVCVPMDLTEAFTEQPTEAQLQEEALRRLNNSEAWLPDENLTVSFVDLAHTADYQAVAALQRVSLCDRVSVYCGPLGVSAVSMQVIRVVYNVLTEAYDEIELGKAKTSFAETITATVEEATKDMPTTSMMQAAINNATEQITGAKGGHILDIFDANGKRQEMLIMDTEDVNTAVKVWRINLGGIGFSRDGYDGPYALAITQDGEIVADFITAGSLSANIIKTGVLDGELVKTKLIQIVDANDNVIASFRDEIVIGAGISKVHINYGTLTITNQNGNEIISIGDIKQSDGKVYVTESFTGDGTTTNFYLNSYSGDKQDVKAYINGNQTTAFTMPYSNRIDFNTAPPNGSSIRVTYYHTSSVYALTFGKRNPNYAIGHHSIVFGENAVANGVRSFANGNLVTASGADSHAEGGRKFTNDVGPTASGQASHAEGCNTVASGDISHAEGYKTTASGWASHSEGEGTIAAENNQHAAGAWNQQAGSNTLEVIGNGTDENHRSNARTLSNNGNEWIAGTLTQASDARLKEESGEVPNVSSVRARRFRWNDKKGKHDDKEHIGYFAQDVEEVAPYLIDVDAMGYKSLDYIALLCAKVEHLERHVAELERKDDSQ